MQTDLEIIKQELENNLGVEAKIQNGTVKAHVDELDGNNILNLSHDIYEVYKGCDVKLKRSGTGITVLVTID